MRHVASRGSSLDIQIDRVAPDAKVLRVGIQDMWGNEEHPRETEVREKVVRMNVGAGYVIRIGTEIGQDARSRPAARPGERETSRVL